MQARRSSGLTWAGTAEQTAWLAYCSMLMCGHGAQDAASCPPMPLLSGAVWHAGRAGAGDAADHGEGCAWDGVAGLFDSCSTACKPLGAAFLPCPVALACRPGTPASPLPPSPPAARKTLAEQKGEAALQPWNTGYSLAGDVEKARARRMLGLPGEPLPALVPSSAGVLGPPRFCLHTHCAALCHHGLTLPQKMDPYLPFADAVDVWARTFSALSINYRGATMALDLCDRDGKYSNG